MCRIHSIVFIPTLVLLSGCGYLPQISSTDAVEEDTSFTTLPGHEDLVVSIPDSSEGLTVRANVNGTPIEIVSSFLEALRSGDETTAEALLTTMAREETERHDLVVRPPGTPTAKFTIGETEYVDAQQQGAHVHSIWTEGEGSSEAVTYEIVWVLRRQEDGWRVAGMATEIIDGQRPVFLNFEDPIDMLEKWQHAEEIATQHEATIRQAQPSTGTIHR